jgi:hypothetical protein
MDERATQLVRVLPIRANTPHIVALDMSASVSTVTMEGPIKNNNTLGKSGQQGKAQAKQKGGTNQFRASI